MLGDSRPELGGSEWAAVVHGHQGGAPPHADLPTAARVHELVRSLVAERVVLGVHDCADGGLAVTLAEMAIAGDCGFTLTRADRSAPPRRGASPRPRRGSS